MSQSATFEMTVNGQARKLTCEHRTTLLDLLREQLDLTGAKRACDQGECGACTVLVDGQAMLACHLLAVQVQEREVTTIEGLANRADFQPILAALLAWDGGQCGFCTPGFAVAGYAALKARPLLNADGLRWALVGHICRCNAYQGIVAAMVNAGNAVNGEAHAPSKKPARVSPGEDSGKTSNREGSR